MTEYPVAVEIRAIRFVDGELLTVSKMVPTELLADPPPGWGKYMIEFFDNVFAKAIADREWELRKKLDQLPDFSETITGEPI